jgi:hypothetical protein
MNESICCICGPVKNCGPYLTRVLDNVEKIGNMFLDYKIIIFYDHSNDTSLQQLKEYRKKNNKLSIYVNSKPISLYRTHNLAFARNTCLQYVKKNQSSFPYFIMMDFDDVNCKTPQLSILPPYFLRSDWDCLSFQTSPSYYDIWALSIYPYTFSYNHFDNHPGHNYHTIQQYITNKINRCQKGELIPCISAFNGFAIYRTCKFMNSYYDGRIRYDLIPKRFMLAHSKQSRSNLLLKNYGNVNGKKEDCEHRAFHAMTITKNDAKIRISPDILFV